MRDGGAGNMKLSLSCFRKESRVRPLKRRLNQPQRSFLRENGEIRWYHGSVLVLMLLHWMKAYFLFMKGNTKNEMDIT